MSIWVAAIRRLCVSNPQRSPARGWLKAPGLPVPAVGDHPIDKLDQVFADLPHSYALDAGVGALEQHREQVRSQAGILKPGRLAKAQHPLVLADSVFLNHAACRVIGVWKLGECVSDCGTAFFHRPQLGGSALTPILKKAVGVPAMFRAEVLPLLLLVRDHSAHPFRDELVLRVEVAVK